MIDIFPVIVPVMIPVPVMPVIPGVVVIVVTVIMMPVEGRPGPPVCGIIVPVPGRTPHYVSWHKYKPDDRPSSNFVGGCANNLHSLVVDPAGVSRVRCFIVNRLNNIVSAIQCLITYQLHSYSSVWLLYYGEYSHILGFSGINGNLKNYEMHIPFNVINNPDIVDVSIAVEIEVVYIVVLIIQTSLESLESF